MKVLLFGGSGQLGQEFVPRARDLNFEVVFPTLDEIDIADKEQVQRFVKKVKPNKVVNFAAYTAVDKAEEEQDLCFSINAVGASNLALAAKEAGARFFHISTDYVFSGDGRQPLSETDPTEPKSIYGKAKLEGERFIMQATNDKATILRTSSLHGAHGNNFVHTMLSLFDQKKEVSVVADQIMSPCWAGFLAESLLDIMRTDFSGIMHVASSSASGVSWYDFAKKIAELSYPANAQPVIRETTLAAFPRPAPRPKYSVFNLDLFKKVLGREPLAWEKGLKSHLDQLGRIGNSS
jgi:dTDP-4-dehydrorhamnose reductase